MLCRSVSDCQSKIAESSVVVFIKENVVRFNVPVNDASLVQIGKGFEYLAKNFPLCLLFFTPGVIQEEVLQRFAFAVLHLDIQYADPLGRVCRLLVCLKVV